MFYLIFEICVLLAICYATFHVSISEWERACHLRLIAVCVTFLLTLVLLELHNLRYYASVIFNSPLLTLVCVNSIVILMVFSSESLFKSVYNYCQFSWTSFLAVLAISSYLNILILDMCSMVHHSMQKMYNAFFAR